MVALVIVPVHEIVLVSAGIVHGIRRTSRF
jgi:hypothetical protein